MPVVVHERPLPPAASPPAIALAPSLDCLALTSDAAAGSVGGSGGAGGVLQVVRWLTWQPVAVVALPASLCPVRGLAWSPDGAPPTLRATNARSARLCSQQRAMTVSPPPALPDTILCRLCSPAPTPFCR